MVKHFSLINYLNDQQQSSKVQQLSSLITPHSVLRD